MPNVNAGTDNDHATPQRPDGRVRVKERYASKRSQNDLDIDHWGKQRCIGHPVC